jgi:hypothetical protein
MRMVRPLAAWLAALTVALVACSTPTPGPQPTAPPQPTPLPATPTPAAAPPFLPKPKPGAAPTVSPAPVQAMDLGEDPDETVLAYLDGLFQVLDQMSVMAEASCDDLKQAVKEDPNVFRSVRGYGATLKRVAAQSLDLSEDEEVQASLAELDVSMGQLEGALSLCGINPN